MVNRMGHHRTLSSHPGPVGMLSKMGGRLISFYADDLAGLLLEDFLAETAVELQRIEKLEKRDYASTEARSMAEDILLAITEYANEESLVATRWNNLTTQRKIKGLGLDGLDNKPKPIEINFGGELEEIDSSQ